MIFDGISCSSWPPAERQCRRCSSGPSLDRRRFLRFGLQLLQFGRRLLRFGRRRLWLAPLRPPPSPSEPRRRHRHRRRRRRRRPTSVSSNSFWTASTRTPCSTTSDGLSPEIRRPYVRNEASSKDFDGLPDKNAAPHWSEERPAAHHESFWFSSRKSLIGIIGISSRNLKKRQLLIGSWPFDNQWRTVFFVAVRKIFAGSGVRYYDPTDGKQWCFFLLQYEQRRMASTAVTLRNDSFRAVVNVRSETEAHCQVAAIHFIDAVVFHRWSLVVPPLLLFLFVLCCLLCDLGGEYTQNSTRARCIGPNTVVYHDRHFFFASIQSRIQWNTMRKKTALSFRFVLLHNWIHSIVCCFDNNYESYWVRERTKKNVGKKTENRERESESMIDLLNEWMTDIEGDESAEAKRISQRGVGW